MRGLLKFGLVMLATSAVLAGACGGGGGDSAAPSGDGNEVFLEPLGDIGSRPFTDSVAVAHVGEIANTKAAGTSSSSGIRSVKGDAPGLYGGSGSQQTCDATALVTFLQENPSKAQAWVDAFNNDPTVGRKLTINDIGSYVGELTSVFLQADTRVTNHGFKNGKATPHQSVLQKGTAVLVDKYGVPRVRCACGNPLLPPKAGSTTYRGAKWKGFTTKNVLVIVPGPKIETIRIVDIHTKEIIEISSGTGCVCNRKIPDQPSTTATTQPDDPQGKTSTTRRNGKTSTTVSQGQQPSPTTVTTQPKQQQPQQTTTTYKQGQPDNQVCYDNQQQPVPCG